jgi:hypothetical protein
MLTAASIAAPASAPAGTLKSFTQNTDLTDGNNYSPAGAPTSSNDVLLTTSATALTLNGTGTSLSMGSINQTNGASYTISNGTSGAATSSLNLGAFGLVNSVSPNPGDWLYIGGANSVLTIQGANSGSGTGRLNLSLFYPGSPVRLNVADATSVLNISATINMPNTVTKAGAGTMNLSGSFGGLSTTLAIEDGVVNFLPGAAATNVALQISNLDSGAGSAVVANVRTSLTVRAVTGGSVAPASSGVNIASLNLEGASTELNISVRRQASVYHGSISGEGSVLINGPSGSQTFAGDISYSGRTTLASGTFAELFIDGTTANQDDYIIGGTLGGSGTIGLAANASVVVGDRGRLSPGSAAPQSSNGGNGIGNLRVQASGTGGVTFSGSATLMAEVGAAGASDQLIIEGGSLDLRSTQDHLSIILLDGAFDGSSYTIATFGSRTGGIFDTIHGLPSGYEVSYTGTSIMLVPVTDSAPVDGTWNGIVTSSPASAAGSGLLKITTSTSGQFTAKVTFGGTKEVFRGTLPTSGASEILRSKSGRLTLQFDPVVNGTLSGTISDGETTSIFVAERSVFTSTMPTPPVAEVPSEWLGRFTLLLRSAGDAAPEGSGYAAVTVTANGTLRAVGKLADGRSFAYGNKLSDEGIWPIYLPFNGGSDAVVGELRWQPSEETDWAGHVRWFRRDSPANGWQLPVYGARYTPPHASETSEATLPLPGLAPENANGNIRIFLSIPDITREANFSSVGKLTVLQPNPEQLKLKLFPATGVMKGAFLSPLTGAKAQVGGVLFQKTNQAAGFHRSSAGSGRFSLELAE